MAEIEAKRLGKMAVKRDRRNLMAARYLASNFPAAYDWQKKRRAVPSRTYGNDAYGDCTVASQANCLIRMERLEQRRTVILPDQTVIANYLEMTGGVDEGWYELDAIKRWRTIGIKASLGRNFTIDGFAEVNPKNIDELKAALFQHKMIKVCFGLPAAWSRIEPPGFGNGRPEGVWDVGDPNHADYEFNSWGGHSMMADAYDTNGLWVVHTWYTGPTAARQLVTWEAVKRYADEAYSVVDSFDHWRQRRALFDVNSFADDVRTVTSD